MSLLFPFANKITGPIDDDDVISTAAIGSGSGSGFNSSWSYTSVDGEIVDFCAKNGSSAGVSVNENSVKRVPVKVWLTLMTIVGIWITSRLVSLFLFS